MSESEVTITVLADGPLEVTGPCTINAADGSTLKTGDKAYLCRCGESAKKPFCDGSHKRTGFSDPGLGQPA
ncbi:MAG: CDGSH iron-sulfur domain-containing protein [Actinomycetota bacterium]|nr:CDGSH iron-sulfur domain-containing protein [Actinomycetota bacterium]